MDANGKPAEFESEETTRPAAKVPDWFAPTMRELQAATRVLSVGQEGVAAAHGAMNELRVDVGDLKQRVAGLERKVGALLLLIELFKGLTSGELFRVLGELSAEQMTLGVGALAAIFGVMARQHTLAKRSSTEAQNGSGAPLPRGGNGEPLP